MLGACTPVQHFGTPLPLSEYCVTVLMFSALRYITFVVALSDSAVEPFKMAFLDVQYFG